MLKNKKNVDNVKFDYFGNILLLNSMVDVINLYILYIPIVQFKNT